MRSRIVRALVTVFVAAMFANLFVTDSVSVAKAAPMVSAGRCDQLIPRGPWAVVQGAGPQEIELGFAGYGHWDLYAAPGLRTVSYITEPGGRFGVYHGYGSAWEQVANCDWSTYPWLTDAQNYQVNRGRTRSAGLVINVNQRPEGNLMVVHLNPFGLSESEVCQVLREQGAAWSFDNGGAPVWVLSEIGMDAGHCSGAPVVSVPVQPVIQQAPPPAANCEPATHLSRDPVVGQAFRFNDAGGWTIVNGWTNEPQQDQAEVTFLLAPGENPTLLMGGSYYIRNAGCHDNAEHEISTSPLTMAGKRVNIQYLCGRGLVVDKQRWCN